MNLVPPRHDAARSSPACKQQIFYFYAVKLYGRIQVQSTISCLTLSRIANRWTCFVEASQGQRSVEGQSLRMPERALNSAAYVRGCVTPLSVHLRTVFAYSSLPKVANNHFSPVKHYPT
jgi:hypothetical protein